MAVHTQSLLRFYVVLYKSLMYSVLGIDSLNISFTSIAIILLAYCKVV